MSRKLSEVSLDERKKILIKLETRKMRDVASEHDVTKNTIGHIRYYHHPKSSAPKRGDYFLDLLEDYESPVLKRLKDYKEQGMCSAEVAERLRIPLEQVNKLWVK